MFAFGQTATKESQVAITKQKEAEIVESSDAIVFISNAEKDGFQEGDGDLMDKLTSSLNNQGFKAIRVVKDSSNIPNNKKPLICAKDSFDKQIIVLAEPRQKTLAEKKQTPEQKKSFIESEKSDKAKYMEMLENRFFEIVMKAPCPHPRKIVYIGSRINTFTQSSGEVTFTESGSIFTNRLIQKLKENGVKVVICCLEFKFFRRSLSELKRAYYMLKHQLLLADKIHFLTQPDKEDFEQVLDDLKANPQLQCVPIPNVADLIIAPITPEDEAAWTRMTFDPPIAEGLLDEQRNKGVFISGIYTVDPFTIEEIKTFAIKLTIPQPHENHLDILHNRRCNVLQFGIIRGEKGIDEAFELASEFKTLDRDNKVIIVGKLMVNMDIIKAIFLKFFPDINSRAFRKMLNDYFASQNIKAKNGKTPTRRDLESNAYIEEMIFSHNEEYFNHVFQEFFNTLKNSYPDKFSPIELHFNMPELKLKELAMQCRYAIKFDHKGMANNASTIASCLGVYLPVFTSCGLVTNKEFINFEMSNAETPSITPSAEAVYGKSVIMENLGLTIVKKEVRPQNPPMNEVAAFILSDTHYMDRLLVLDKLRNDRVFDCEKVAENLILTIFKPLCDTAPIATPQSTTSQSPSYTHTPS